MYCRAYNECSEELSQGEAEEPLEEEVVEQDLQEEERQCHRQDVGPA